ncbi:hypothetical protein GMLC_19940 [Geomonas limicola]|uniref:PDGLE domain-containing protein n=1 Tax=Geomonas limicola TaxID=2740186 RepID=A0A6V8N755_9BACT|nr:hypothetical protein [Geomonas limicola]GFO68415.1 hypothetical protein GMLC_19940 [Geomonas limicola]
MKPTERRTRLYTASVVILVLGLTCSVLIALSASDVAPDATLGNPLEESKGYRRSLEMYGGRANLLAAQFMEWFAALWQGKALGITLGWLTLAVALIVALIAYHLPDDSE